MEKQNYDKPLFKVHLIPLADKGGPGCNIAAITDPYKCPVDILGDGTTLFQTSAGCIEEGQTDGENIGLCYEVPVDGYTIFWS